MNLALRAAAVGRHLLLAQRPNSVLGVWQAVFLLTAEEDLPSWSSACSCWPSLVLPQCLQLLAILGAALSA